MGNIQISDIDIEHLKIIRENVVSFMMQCASKYASGPGKLLDIAPQNHEGARPFFKDTVYIDTLDIDPAS